MSASISESSIINCGVNYGRKYLKICHEILKPCAEQSAPERSRRITRAESLAPNRSVALKASAKQFAPKMSAPERSRRIALAEIVWRPKTLRRIVSAEKKLSRNVSAPTTTSAEQTAPKNRRRIVRAESLAPNCPDPPIYSLRSKNGLEARHRTIEKIAITYHKAVKRVARRNVWDSNHEACNIVGVQICKHLIAKRSVCFYYSMLKSKSPCIKPYQNFIRNRSLARSELDNLFVRNYGVTNFYNNPLCALISRINFIERTEPRSSYSLER